jgi:hypothetical protein
LSLPPLTPEPVRSKTFAWLKVRNVRFVDVALEYCCTENSPTEKYVCECLVLHFEAGRKVYQKWKDDGSGLLPNTTMHLNLHSPEAVVQDIYVQLQLEKHVLSIPNIHVHRTTPLPR